MDFHHLKYFVEVADKKSFSKAARTLHISQSAISRTIKALEENWASSFSCVMQRPSN